ncbi:MAG: hypothetical protein KAQ85_08570 [Thermodesulfovibrionia bacterium]|nr:hypothetical protein [Thermodesulfovibrionia bacterium]
MTEILKFKGRLAEKEFTLKAMRLRIRGLVDAIRDNLDPLGDIADIKADIAAEQAIELANLKIRYTEIVADIQAIKKVLWP